MAKNAPVLRRQQEYYGCASYTKRRMLRLPQSRFFTDFSGCGYHEGTFWSVPPDKDHLITEGASLANFPPV
ncbi:hypothetical protein JCM10212_001665 [Sporobolomyces blumeae]